MHRIIAASLCLLALGVTSASAQADHGSCLRVDQIYSFSPIKGTDRALVVIDKAQRRYRVSLLGPCAGLDFNMGIGIKSHGIGGLSCVSRGDNIISHDPGVAGNRCTISRVEPYTVAMERSDRDAAARRH
jgi:hypothetical protein